MESILQKDALGLLCQIKNLFVSKYSSSFQLEIISHFTHKTLEYVVKFLCCSVGCLDIVFRLQKKIVLSKLSIDRNADVFSSIQRNRWHWNIRCCIDFRPLYTTNQIFRLAGILIDSMFGMVLLEFLYWSNHLGADHLFDKSMRHH